MKYDELFQYVGEIGVYQVCVAALCFMFSVFGVESVAMIFVTHAQEHWCRVEELEELPHTQQRYIASPWEDQQQGVYSSCTQFTIDYSQYSTEDLLTWNRSVRVGEDTNVTSCQSWVWDQSLFVSTATKRYDLVCDQAGLQDLGTSLFFVGFLFGSLATGMISDRYGRWVAVMYNIVIRLISGTMVVLADSYPLFCVGKFLQGWGVPGAFESSFVLVMELIGPSYRAAVGVGFNIAFSVGFMLLPGMAYMIRDDRILQLVMFLPNIVFITYAWLLPESPRWLIERKMYKKAGKVLHKMATINEREIPPDVDLRLIEKNHEDTIKQKNFLALLTSSLMRKRSLILWLHWFVDSLLYYSLTLNTAALHGDLFLNTFISGFIEVPAQIVCIVCSNWRVTGRRHTMSWALILAGVFSFITIPLLVYDLGNAYTATAMIGKAFVTISFSGVFVYTAELYPTEVRSVGLGFCSVSARVAGIIAPYIGFLLTDTWQGLPMLIFGVCGTLAGGLTLLLPETLGQPMYDTIAEAEKDHRDKKSEPPIKAEADSDFAHEGRRPDIEEAVFSS